MDLSSRLYGTHLATIKPFAAGKENLIDFNRSIVNLVLMIFGHLISNLNCLSNVKLDPLGLF